MRCRESFVINAESEPPTHRPTALAPWNKESLEIMLDNVTWQQLDISFGRRGKSGRGVWGFGTVLPDIIAACIDINSVRGSTIKHSSSI